MGPSGLHIDPSGLLLRPSGVPLGPNGLLMGPNGLLMGPSGHLLGPCTANWHCIYRVMQIYVYWDINGMLSILFERYEAFIYMQSLHTTQDFQI